MGTVPISVIYGFKYTAEVHTAEVNKVKSSNIPKRGEEVTHAKTNHLSSAWPSSLSPSQPSTKPLEQDRYRARQEVWRYKFWKSKIFSLFSSHPQDIYLRQDMFLPQDNCRQQDNCRPQDNCPQQ